MSVLAVRPIAEKRVVAPVLPDCVVVKILFRTLMVPIVAFVTARPVVAMDPAVPPVMVPCILTVLWNTFTVLPVPPPSTMPAAMSGEVLLCDTPEIMLLAITEVPEDAELKAIPNEVFVPVPITLPITLFVIVALVTSFATVVVPVYEVPIPALIAARSLVPLISEIVLQLMVKVFSKPVRIPIVPMLFGETLSILFNKIEFPVFLAPALAPCE